MQNADMPAMPIPNLELGYQWQNRYDWRGNAVAVQFDGMSKRETFVMHIAAGMMANPKWDGESEQFIAESAISLAEELLERLDPLEQE